MNRLVTSLVFTLLTASQAVAGQPASNPDSARGAALGIEVADSLEARQHGHDGGVVVASVEPRSAAARAGIRQGDVLLQLGGDPIVSAEALARSLAAREAGKPVAVRLLRNGREKVLTAQPTAGEAQLRVDVPVVSERIERELDIALSDALAEGSLAWSLPEGSLVAKLDGGPDLSIRVNGEGDEQHLVIEIDGEVVVDTRESEGEFTIDLDFD